MALRRSTPKMAQARQRIQIATKRLQNQKTEVFRKYVWALFLRLVENTPQFSGAATANWNIGVGSPEGGFDPGLGVFNTASQNWRGVSKVGVQHKGSRPSLLVAMRRNLNKLVSIQPGTPVYITNETPYLEPLQHNWRDVLREVNRPYEVIEQSAVIVAAQFKTGKRRSNYGYSVESIRPVVQSSAKSAWHFPGRSRPGKHKARRRR